MPDSASDRVRQYSISISPAPSRISLYSLYSWIWIPLLAAIASSIWILNVPGSGIRCSSFDLDPRCFWKAGPIEALGQTFTLNLELRPCEDPGIAIAQVLRGNIPIGQPVQVRGGDQVHLSVPFWRKMADLSIALQFGNGDIRLGIDLTFLGLPIYSKDLYHEKIRCYGRQIRYAIIVLLIIFLVVAAIGVFIFSQRALRMPKPTLLVNGNIKSLR